MKKRAIAFLASLVMIISLLPIPGVSAAEGLKENTDEVTYEKVSFTLEFMQYTESAKKEFEEDPNDEGYSTIDDVGEVAPWRNGGKSAIVQAVTPDSTKYAEGYEFLVGIKVTNLDSVVESDFGLNNLCLTLLYDPTVLEPQDTIANLASRVEQRLGLRSSSLFTTREASMPYTVYYNYNSNSGSVGEDTPGVINLPLGSSSIDTQSTYKGEKDEYVAIIKFKMLTVPSSPKEVMWFPNINDLGAISRYTMSFGIRGEKATYSAVVAPINIQTILTLNDSELDLFPSTSGPTATGLAVDTGELTSPQYEGATASTAGVTLKYTAMSDGSTPPPAVDASDVTWHYSESTISSAGDLKDENKVPETWPAGSAGKTYNIYAKAKGLFVSVGTIEVKADSIASIAQDGTLPSGVYAGDTITFDDLLADVTMASGTNVNDISFGNFASNSLAIYRVEGESGSETYTLMDSTNNTYGVGVNKFVIGTTAVTSGVPDVKSAVFTVDAPYNATTLIYTGDNAVKTVYAAGAKFDPSGIKVMVKKDSESAATMIGYSGFATAGLKVVIAADATAAETAAEADANTEITQDMIDNGYNIYVVVDNNGTKQALGVGKITDKAVKEVTGVTAIAGMEYGKTLADDPNFKITVEYNDGTSEALSLADFLESGGSLIAQDGTTLTADTVLKPAMSGNIEIYVGTTKQEDKTTALNVKQKDVKVTAAVNDGVRPYNGKLELDAAEVTLSIVAADLLSTDSALAGELNVTGLSYKFGDKNVGANKAITSSGTLTAVDKTSGSGKAAEFNANYKLVQDATSFGALKGEIKQRDLTVSVIDNVPSVEEGAATLSDTETMVLKTTNSDMVDGDTVSITYTYTYDPADVKAGTKPTVDITGVSLVAGGDAGNYKLIGSPTSAEGEVTSKVLNTISVASTSTLAASYTYPSTFSLAGLKIDLNYAGAASPTTLEIDDFFAKDGTISLTDASGATRTLTKASDVAGITLKYDVATTLTIKYEGKETTTTVTANRKPINLSEIAFSPKKTYGLDDAATLSGAPVIVDSIVVEGDEVSVKATYTFTDDPEAAGAGKTVSITGIELDGADKDNYVLVGGTEIELTNGVIVEQKKATPAAPVLSVDKKTNKIKIEQTQATDLLYSIDGIDWKDVLEFDGLEKGQTYTIKVKAKAEPNYLESDVAEATITTYAYYVKALVVNTSTVAASSYTDDITTPATDAEINSMIFGSTPTGFNGYYSDAAGTAKLSFPLIADGENNVTIYMKKATNNGPYGGGGVSVKHTVTYEVGEGTIESGKQTESVSNGSKPKNVPTVTAKDGYVFKGWSLDGETIVNPKTVAIKKDTTFTAIYEEYVVEPVDPDKPVIDVKYDAPYANGYEDRSFRPDEALTRGELAAMIARISNEGELPNGVFKASFADVTDGDWYNKYVGYLENYNILTGYPDGEFKGGQSITRGEFATMLVRAQNYEIIASDDMFTDIASHWAKDAITTLASKGIVTGYAGGEFMPSAQLTRAEAVTMLNRVLEYSDVTITFTPNDIAGHWAEEDIILAVNERQLSFAEETTEEPTDEATGEETTEEPTDEATDAEGTAEDSKKEEADAEGAAEDSAKEEADAEGSAEDSTDEATDAKDTSDAE